MELDQSEREAFINEIDDRLQDFGEILLEYEKNPDQTDLLNRIFRVAHTIKGNAGFVSLENMVRLAHSMESMLERLREGAIALNPDLAGVLLESGDLLKRILDEFSVDGPAREISVDSLADRIDSLVESALASGASPGSVAPGESTSSATAASGESTDAAGVPDFIIRIRLKSEAPLPGMRAYLLRKKLTSVATILAERPHVDEYDNKTFNGEFEFSVTTDTDEEGLYRALRNHEIDTLEVSPGDLPVEGAPGSPATGGDKADVLFVTGDEGLEAETGPARPENIEVLRVPIKKVDDILNLVGELLSANSAYLALANDFRKRFGKRGLYNSIRENSESLTRISAELQEKVMKVRMIPVGSVLNRFRRLVRDFNAEHSDKEIDLEIQGEETEVDKKQIDNIYEPLLHLVRNSLDHGIEPAALRQAAGKPRRGKITLRSFQAGNNIFIEVEDNGGGLNADKIRAQALSRGLITQRQAADYEPAELFNFIFLPGFSTAEKVTDISGRGVGMDAVKRTIEALNGAIQVFSEPGESTRFTINIPLSMAIVTALKVVIEGRLFAIPISVILETIKITEQDIFLVDKQESIAIRDTNVPLLRVAKEIGMEPRNGGAVMLAAGEAGTEGKAPDQAEKRKSRKPVVVVQFGGSRVGLMVDELIGYEDLVIKSLSKNYEEIDGLAGAAIMGKGEICLILDVNALITGPEARQGGDGNAVLASPFIQPSFSPKELPPGSGSASRAPAPASRSTAVQTPPRPAPAPPASRAASRLTVSETQLKAIKKIISTGRVNSLAAVRALTENKNLGMKFSTTRVQSMAKFRRQAEELAAGTELHSFYVRLENEFTGNEIMLISRANMIKLAAMMYGEPMAGTLTPEIISAITEITNILAVSFTNAISVITGRRVLPTVPEYLPDFRRLSQELKTGDESTVLMVETEFTHENEESMLHLFFLLGPEDIQKMEIKHR